MPVDADQIGGRLDQHSAPGRLHLAASWPRAGRTTGFIVALVAPVPLRDTAIPISIWDRGFGFRENTLLYWVVIWGMFPAYGIAAGVYCALQLLG